MDDKDRYKQALGVFSKDPQRGPFVLMVAICYTQLADYVQAKRQYRLALESLLEDPRRSWHAMSLPEWLIESYVLAGCQDYLERIAEEIGSYKLDYRGSSPGALFAYALLSLAMGQDQEARDYVPGILKRPKEWKLTFACGETVKAIVEHDQAAFDRSLQELLLAHRGQAKFGALRESPEGFLCLPAMCLSEMALDRGLLINVESEYLSMGYLRYLHTRPREPETT